MNKPKKSEYDPFYETYVGKAIDFDVFVMFEEQLKEINMMLRNVVSGTEEWTDGYRYKKGKWSLKEVLGHLIDEERVFGYRAFVFSRKDKAAIAGMDQDDYIKSYNYKSRTMSDMVEEFKSLRKANIIMFKGFSDATLMLKGIASKCEFTIRAIAYIMAGHTEHHLEVIKEKYLS